MFKKLYFYQLKPLCYFLPVMLGSLFIHRGIINVNAGQAHYTIHPLMYVISFVFGMTGVAVMFRHFAQIGVSRKDFYLSLVARQLTFALIYFLLLAFLTPVIDKTYPDNVLLSLVTTDGKLSQLELVRGYLSILLAHLIFGILGVHLALLFNKVTANGRGLLLGGIIVLVWTFSVFWDMGAGEYLAWLLETALQVTQLGLLVILLALLWFSIYKHNSKEYYK
ncbi:hypothetical protein [Streptococcus sp. S784/96/1]|uniref:hypothetical protein n=1 Tax=Streptococcus sp. S784/96/1 TaxID=2653499 RepID=UPI0013871FC3|nr:hypothetical protein [Streptococcus sp. S784/96/1]